MDTLVACFHPQRKEAGHSVVVARVVVSGGQVQVVPARWDPGVGVELDPHALLQKLDFLVNIAKPNVMESLPLLRTDYWSFHLEEPGAHRER